MQTGSGKTYTMLGDHMSLGIVTMALMDTLAEVERRSADTRFRVHASLIEIYNERIVDLFAAAERRPAPERGINIVVWDKIMRLCTMYGACMHACMHARCTHHCAGESTVLEHRNPLWPWRSTDHTSKLNLQQRAVQAPVALIRHQNVRRCRTIPNVASQRWTQLCGTRW